MSKKNQPLWQMLEIPEPPIVRGMWEYGVVFDPALPQPRFFWIKEASRAVYWCLWSYRHWSKKLGVRIWLREVWTARTVKFTSKGEAQTLD